MLQCYCVHIDVTTENRVTTDYRKAANYFVTPSWALYHVPWLSWLATAAFGIGTLALMFIPLRLIVLAYGEQCVTIFRCLQLDPVSSALAQLAGNCRVRHWHSWPGHSTT